MYFKENNLNKKITILITAAGNVFMNGITSCLKNNGEKEVRLIGADMNDDPTMLSMFDKYYAVPKCDDPVYIDRLFEICKKEKVDVLLPIMSAELVDLAKETERFKSIGTNISVSNYNSVEIASDKLKLLTYMREKNMQCAEFYKVSNISELEHAIEKLGYPNKKVCVKIANGSGSRGFRILDNNHTKLDAFLKGKPSSAVITFEEFKSIVLEADKFPELIVMEYLPGEEYTVDLLADNGNVIISCCRKSLRMENSIMLDSVVIHNQQIENMCSQIVSLLNLDGNIGFDIREREDGTPIIMECNPRITAGISIFAHAGVNLPWLCIKKIYNEKIYPQNLKLGVIVKRRWMEMFSCE